MTEKITQPQLEWLENPEVFQVNRLDAHSDHAYYVCLLYTSDAADEL